MKTSSRLCIAVAALLMLTAFFLPLWKITLEAPQYPEGLGMDIWLNGITGNVVQINGLNHYIGMKHINPEEFVEFKALPYVFGLLVLLAVLTALKGSKKMLVALFVFMLVFAVAGLADFYIWEYNYGHNLDPRAAIKIEGMYYQPPLFGYKQLLNFLAGSFPAAGGVLVGLAGIMVAVVLFVEKIRYRNDGKISTDAAAGNIHYSL